MVKNFLVTAIGSFSSPCVIESLRNVTFGKIIGCDIFPSEWHHVSRKLDRVYRAPKVSNEREYKDFISTVCVDNSIDFIIPLTDIEVDFFNKWRNHFNSLDIIPTIANRKFLEIARDKSVLNNYLVHLGLPHIKSFLPEEIDDTVGYPLIGKPKNGRSSEGIYYLNSPKDFQANLNNQNYVYQEFKKGDIITVDIVRSSCSSKCFLVARKELLRTKNGAGMTVEIIKNETLNNIVKGVVHDLDLNGCVNMEFIQNEGEFYLIDINPRFSAGIGFSHLTGYDFVKSHVASFLNQDILPGVRYETFIAEKVMTEVINKFTDGYE